MSRTVEWPGGSIKAESVSFIGGIFAVNVTQRDPDQPNAEAAALIEDLDGLGDDEIAKVPISWPATTNFFLKGKLSVLYGGDD